MCHHWVATEARLCMAIGSSHYIMDIAHGLLIFIAVNNPKVMHVVCIPGDV